MPLTVRNTVVCSIQKMLESDTCDQTWSCAKKKQSVETHTSTEPLKESNAACSTKYFQWGTFSALVLCSASSPPQMPGLVKPHSLLTLTLAPAYPQKQLWSKGKRWVQNGREGTEPLFQNSPLLRNCGVLILELGLSCD